MDVGMTSQLDHKAGLERQLARTGGQVPPMPDGAKLDYFAALELAQAMESEINRAMAGGLSKLRLDMDFGDAQKLASYLRRAVLMGV
jgi:hypothetical protein